MVQSGSAPLFALPLALIQMANAFAYLASLEHSELPMRAGHHDANLPHINGTDCDGKPLFIQTTDFDFDSIDQRNGWTDPKPAAEAEKDKAFEAGADLLNELIRWFSRSDTLGSAGLRAWALVVAVRPDLLPARNQAQLAAMLGITRQAISKRVAEVFRMGQGIFTHGNMCRGAAAREAIRIRTIRRHVAAGHVLHLQPRSGNKKGV